MTEVARLGAEEFAPYADACVETYVAAMNAPAAELRSRPDLLRRHLGRPGFTAMVGLDGGRLVGFGYAYPGQSGQWWHDIVVVGLGRQAAERWMSDSFEIVELHVRPESQGAGLGRRLLTGLLTGAPGRTAVLSTHDRDSRARHLYRSMEFVDLLTGFRFPGREEDYAVLGRPLPMLAG